MMSSPKCFWFRVYAESKAIKLTLEHGYPRICCLTAMQLQLCQQSVHHATDFQYQAFSSLDKHDNHVATAVEVRENVITKYMAQINELANRQQERVVIEI